MFFKYGSYQHPANEVNLTSFDVRAQFSDRGVHISTLKTMRLSGPLIAGSQAAITAAIQTLEAAYSKQGQDAGLYQDDGTVTPHFLDSSKATGGVRIVGGVTFPQGTGAEYATQRTFAIVLEADFPKSGASNLLSFTETISISGSGGPRTVMVEVLDGPPQEQTVNRQTIVRVRQSGNAVGFQSYPVPPGPLFRQGEKEDQRLIDRGNPDRMRNDFVNFPISWSYSFELADFPQSARPTKK